MRKKAKQRRVYFELVVGLGLCTFKETIKHVTPANYTITIRYIIILFINIGICKLYANED